MSAHVCPHCKKPILSPNAEAQLNSARNAAAARGGFIWEDARPRYERGEYPDTDLDEMLAAGAIEPHPDPAKGWVVKW